MVERMAMAMQQRAKEPLGNIESLEPVLVGSLGDAWKCLARAALEAARVPTWAMIDSCPNEDAGFVWQDMIDEALK